MTSSVLLRCILLVRIGLVIGLLSVFSIMNLDAYSYAFSPVINVAPVVTGIQGATLSNTNSPLSYTGSTLDFLGDYYKAEGADFNKDGFGDMVLVGNGNGNANIWQPGDVKINLGNGNYSTVNLSGDTRDSVVGDFNNDGNLDIVFLHPMEQQG
jgi:hypothetical protein